MGRQRVGDTSKETEGSRVGKNWACTQRTERDRYS